ncbi:MAG: hypothetical protein AAGG02_21800, partial [Cyanobacteria bacterium P01_H01_bin.15]
VWDSFEMTYLKTTRELGIVSSSRVPVKPSRFPWLATLIIPSSAHLEALWLADFEQCLAQTFIQKNELN